jgi:hypothetical protein
MKAFRSELTAEGKHVMYFHSSKETVEQALADMTEQAKRFGAPGKLSTPVEMNAETRGEIEYRHYVRNADGSLDVREA